MPFVGSTNRGVARITEPGVLFPSIAILLLAAVWAMTVSIIGVRHSAAEQAAAASTGELLNTYEAQVVRAVREIDLSLNLVKFWHETARGRQTLRDLSDRGLLPPDLVFVVSIADATGVIIDSTRPHTGESVAQRDYFLQQQARDSLIIGKIAGDDTGQATLHFSRRLDAAGGTFDGVVIIAVDSAYFVSGYESSKLGEHGILGVLGSDGMFLVRRIGDQTFSGGAIHYKAAVAAPDAVSASPDISTNDGDSVRRWVSARELYGFPLDVVVGLSIDEQMAEAQREQRNTTWWAILASGFIIVILTVLGRMSWQLSQSRLRERAASLAYAQNIEFQAYHDGLTGLPNRSMFSKLLIQGISEAQRGKKTLAVAFLDLDRFKQINDVLGHEAGDQLLQEVAARLRAGVREGDSVARLGGDEFVVLLPELDHGQAAATVAEKILALVARPFTLFGQEFNVTASLGISVYPQDGLDEQTLTKNADVAMYQAKAEGKNNFQFYSTALNAHSLERLTLESDLRHALARNEFRLYYQTKRDIVSGSVTGMEALLRWQHIDLGLVLPVQFMSVAEESGLIVPIGKWVIKTACLQNVAWQKQGLPVLSMAVNLTACQFYDDHLARDVASILAESGMDPRLLELEFTEDLLIRNVEDTLRILKELKAIGCRIAVDNFGVGYSSLTSLQRFPLDTIKVDSTLIRDITSAAQDAGLAKAIIAMGKSLSLTVVAQGVETRDQAEFLRKHACDELQGFYFEKPLPADQATRLLLTQETGITHVGKALELSSLP